MGKKIILLGIFLLAITFFPVRMFAAQSNLVEKQVGVSLRMVGHKMLLLNGDSLSRVLPIEKEGGSYLVKFESEFELQPEALLSIADEVLLGTGISGAYFMEVLDCQSETVVYSYKMDIDPENNVTPCLSRVLPESCYFLRFTLQHPLMLGSYARMDGEEHEPEPKKERLAWLWYVLIIVTLGGFVLLRFKGRNKKLDQTHIKAIGRFHFDEHKALLILREQQIELSSKEADLLSVLYSSVNQTVERDVILNRVWGDEGDYVGRTLDVFVSKLRKKLEADASVKIVNIRGVGYKLVVD